MSFIIMLTLSFQIWGATTDSRITMNEEMNKLWVDEGINRWGKIYYSAVHDPCMCYSHLFPSFTWHWAPRGEKKDNLTSKSLFLYKML